MSRLPPNLIGRSSVRPVGTWKHDREAPRRSDRNATDGAVSKLCRGMAPGCRIGLNPTLSDERLRCVLRNRIPGNTTAQIQAQQHIRNYRSKLRFIFETIMSGNTTTRTAGSEPWSIQLRTVCWFSFKIAATSAIVRNASSTGHNNIQLS